MVEVANQLGGNYARPSKI